MVTIQIKNERKRNRDGTARCRKCGHTYWSHYRLVGKKIEPGKCRTRPRRAEMRGPDGRCTCAGFE